MPTEKSYRVWINPNINCLSFASITWLVSDNLQHSFINDNNKKNHSEGVRNWEANMKKKEMTETTVKQIITIETSRSSLFSFQIICALPSSSHAPFQSDLLKWEHYFYWAWHLQMYFKVAKNPPINTALLTLLVTMAQDQCLPETVNKSFWSLIMSSHSQVQCSLVLCSEVICNR